MGATDPSSPDQKIGITEADLRAAHNQVVKAWRERGPGSQPPVSPSDPDLLSVVEEICELAGGPARPKLEKWVKSCVDGYKKALGEAREFGGLSAPPLPYPARKSDVNACCANLAVVHDRFCNSCAPLWPESPADDPVGGVIRVLLQRKVNKKPDPAYLRERLAAVKAALAGGSGADQDATGGEERTAGSGGDRTPPQPQYVTIGHIAAIIQRSPRTVEKWKGRAENPLPPPDIEGGGGKPDEWVWETLRPWLEANSRRQLPERFPMLCSF